MYFIKIEYNKNNKLWYSPDTGLMCTHEGQLVNADEWRQKNLHWSNPSNAPRQVLRALGVLQLIRVNLRHELIILTYAYVQHSRPSR